MFPAKMRNPHTSPEIQLEGRSEDRNGEAPRSRKINQMAESTGRIGARTEAAAAHGAGIQSNGEINWEDRSGDRYADRHFEFQNSINQKAPSHSFCPAL